MKCVAGGEGVVGAWVTDNVLRLACWLALSILLLVLRLLMIVVASSFHLFCCLFLFWVQLMRINQLVDTCSHSDVRAHRYTHTQVAATKCI